MVTPPSMATGRVDAIYSDGVVHHVNPADVIKFIRRVIIFMLKLQSFA